jgi:hypothetical protein
MASTSPKASKTKTNATGMSSLNAATVQITPSAPDVVNEMALSYTFMDLKDDEHEGITFTHMTSSSVGSVLTVVVCK